MLRRRRTAARDRRGDVHREGRRRAAGPAAGRVREGAVRRRGRRQRDRAEQALDDLDAAAIGTLHSFAQRILTAHPIEAGLPPLIEVLDEVGSSVAFEERWAELRASCWTTTRSREPLLLALAVGVTLEHLRSLARLFGNDWDLIDDRVLAEPPDAVARCRTSSRWSPRRPGSPPRSTTARDPTTSCCPSVTAIRRLRRPPRGRRRRRRPGSPYCSRSAGSSSGWAGRRNWPDIEAVQADCVELVARATELVEVLLDASLRPLAHWIAQRVLESAERAGPRAGWSSTTCWCWPATCCARDAAVRDALQRRVPAAAAGRVPGHRPDPDRARRADRRWSRAAAAGLAGRRRPARVGCSWSATRSSRSTASAGPTSRPTSRRRSTLGEHGRARRRTSAPSRRSSTGSTPSSAS